MRLLSKSMSILLVLVLLIMALGQVALGSEFVRIGTAGSGGNFYRLGAGMMALMNEKFGNEYFYSIQATRGTPHNLELVNDGEVEIAFVSAWQSIAAYETEDLFSDHPEDRYQNMGFLTFVYPNVTHFGVAEWAQNDIKSLEDIKGKRVAKGLIGSAADMEIRTIILPAMGMTMEDIRPEHTVHQGTIDQLRNRQIDAAIWADGIFSASWTEMAETGMLKFLDFPDHVIEAATEGRVAFPLTIEPGSYPNQNEPFNTWGDPIAMVGNLDMSEQTAYDYLKAIYEHTDYLIDVIPLAKFITLENALNGKGIPFHPGAERFYREVGLIN